MRCYWKKMNGSGGSFMSYRERRQKHKQKQKSRNHSRYTFLDFLGDVLFYVPELILLPFRLLWWIVRGVIKFADWTVE